MSRIVLQDGIPFLIEDDGKITPVPKLNTQTSPIKKPSLGELAAKQGVNVASTAATGAGAEALGLSAGGVGAGAITGLQQLQGAKAVGNGKKLSTVQQAALALPTFGASFLYNPIKKFFGFGGGTSTHQEEANRAELAKQGINVENAGVKEWENNPKFRESRNEADLVGKDIINAAQFYKNIPGYDKFDAARKEAIANEALKQKLIREEHGQIDVGMNAEFQKFLDSQNAGTSSNNGSPGRRPGQHKQQASENKKQRQKAALVDIIPAEITSAPRYDKIDVTNLIRNPYI